MHCEYMAVAKKTSVSREATLSFVETSRSGVTTVVVKVCPAEYADIC